VVDVEQRQLLEPASSSTFSDFSVMISSPAST
jgi:hypothetical protein